jgi:hypothetical protein
MGYKLVKNDEHEAIIFDEEGLSSAKKYWTEERMKKAIPIDVELPGNGYASEIVVENDVTDADVNSPPFDAGGKLFFSQGGNDYVASAQFSGDKKLILTAAHCVRDMDSGDWSENIVFKRGYKFCSCDQSCSIRAVALKSYWYSDKDYRWDYAFGISTSDCDVTPLNYIINSPYPEVTAFGYPENYGSNLYMKKVDGQTDNMEASGIVKMEGNTMRSGCSGGAWVEKGGLVISGLNSFHYTNDTSSLYGPLFTADFDSLYAYAKTLI